MVFVLVLLGIQAFYPAPRYDNFCNQSQMFSDPLLAYQKCSDDMTMKECRVSIGNYDKEIQKCQTDFDNANKVYGKYFFIIASILSVIILLIAFFLLNMINISAGIACSGIVFILVAFIRGWEGTDDKVKFAVGIIITAIVIALAVIVNKKLAKEK